MPYQRMVNQDTGEKIDKGDVRRSGKIMAASNK